MAISLDGTEPYHNHVRGNNDSYRKTIATLTGLKKYSNIDVLIESAIMKQNIDNLDEMVKEHSQKFPSYEIKYFLPSPAKKDCGNMNCRIEAYRLTNDTRNANPYTCVTIKGDYSL